VRLIIHFLLVFLYLLTIEAWLGKTFLGDNAPFVYFSISSYLSGQTKHIGVLY